jgi:hypothetical protein
MVLEDFRQAVGIVGQNPALWLSGIAAGLLCAVLWLIYNFMGAFFATRLVILAALVLVLFVAGTFVMIKKNAYRPGTMVVDGARSYFRVLLPLLVIAFILALAAILIMVVMVLMTGSSTDYTAVGFLALIVMIPLIMVTCFADTAAVFEDRGVFASLRRSVELTTARSLRVLGFFVVCCAVAFVNFFIFAVLWEGILFEKLEPLTAYNETQLAAITPEQLIGMIGPDGIWVTALVIFLSLVLLVPVLLTYKVCVYRSLAGNLTVVAPPIQQMTGEFDSKGRWYKY